MKILLKLGFVMKVPINQKLSFHRNFIFTSIGSTKDEVVVLNPVKAATKSWEWPVRKDHHLHCTTFTHFTFVNNLFVNLSPKERLYLFFYRQILSSSSHGFQLQFRSSTIPWRHYFFLSAPRTRGRAWKLLASWNMNGTFATLLIQIICIEYDLMLFLLHLVA